MFKLSVVTDEISSDVETALELASSWGLRHVELRGVGSQRIGSLDEYHFDNLQKSLARYCMHVASLSPGLFKIPFTTGVYEGYTVLRWQDEYEFYAQRDIRALADRHLNELLPRSIESAHKLGAENIGIFSFNRPDMSPVKEIPAFVLDYLGNAARLAQKEGIRLLLENEHICWGDTAANAVRIIEQIGSPSLQLNWDPGNAYYSHERPFPEGYAAARGHVAHVHMKDAITEPDGGMTYVVQGEIDWESQLQALLDDGYTGFVTIETHCRPKVQSAKDTLERILKVTGPQALEMV